MTEEARWCVEALRICCSQNDCRDCKFMEADVNESSCVDVLFHNSADLIESLSAQLEQVEKERDGLNIMLAQAQAMLETRTKERHGRWEDIKGAIRCSECQEKPLYDYHGRLVLTRWCHACGVKMWKEIKSENH